MSDDKTEKPTGKKIADSRKEGKVPRTAEIGAWTVVLCFGAMLPSLASREIKALRELFLKALTMDHQPDVPHSLQLLGEGMKHAFMTIVILSLVVMVVSIVFTLSQGGFFIASKAMKPSLKKFDLIAGAKRMFGKQILWEGLKILLKTSLVGVVVWRSVRDILPLIGGLVPFDSVMGIASDAALVLIRNVAVVGVLIGFADYAMARRRIGKELKMTKEEVKQEYKNSEGDPQVKGQIKAKQRAAARARMMGAVPTADVVLVNPTHIAVALRYDPANGAPTVVASGSGVIAGRIREIASEHRVPIVRDVPLARALYRHTEVGQQIPNELFAAVATVLAFVITQKRRGYGGGEHTSPRGDAPLPVVPKKTRAKTVRDQSHPPHQPPNQHASQHTSQHTSRGPDQQQPPSRLPART